MPNNPLDLARLYHINSSNVRAVQPDLTLDWDARPLRFRTYPGSPRISLPACDFRFDMPFGTVLERRRSIREFAPARLSLETIARLLRASYGVAGRRQIEGEWTFARPVPSGGGLYPLELYLAIERVNCASDGLYHYDSRGHELEFRNSGRFLPQLAEMTLGQDMIARANLLVIIAANFQRTLWKYGQRGYRYVWLEAGHVGQNVHLATTALGLGAVAIGGFFDVEVHALLGLPDEEDPIYLFAIGQPADGAFP